MKKLFSYKGFFAYLAMVFINAFVDLGHKIIIQNTIFKVYDGDTQIMLTAVVNGLILLPFILLFTPAGFLADKYPKPKVMRNSALIAIAATLLITLSYWQGWFLAAFALTFVLGIQSAIYSPAKYGYIKELIGVNNLAQGNAIIQATTIVSILLSTFVFSALFEYLLTDLALLTTATIMKSVVLLGWVLVSLSLLEWWFSCQLEETKPQDDNKQLSLPRYLKGEYLRANFHIIFEKRAIWLSIIGLSMFWAISQVMLASFPAFAKEALGETNTLVIQGILASTGIGIVIGSLWAANISKNHIELGLIPISAIGFALLLGCISQLDSRLSMALVFMGLGITGGLFIVPLNSLIQYHAKADELGTVLAGNNLVQNVTMLLFLIATIALVGSGILTTQLFTLLMAIALVGAIYTVYQLPHSLITIIAALILKRRYKFDVLGFEHLPENKGVLLLGNHVSWIDGILLQMASPRPVRFVILRSIYNLWYIKPVVTFFGCIPISSGNSKSSLKLVNNSLKNGDVVCLFPEGAISRTGSLGVFRKGYEQVIDDVEGVIIPFYLHGLWGSRLSRANSKKLRSNTTSGLRRSVSLTFGAPLPMNTPANELKQKVFELSFNAWEHQTASAEPIPLAWLRAAKKNLNNLSVADTHGTEFSNKKLMASTVAFAKKIKQLDSSQNIALMLPASSAGTIANMAVMLNGQTAVNLNYTTHPDAVKSGISNANIKTVITSQQFLKRLQSKGLDTEKMLTGTNVVLMEDLKNHVSKATFVLSFIAAYFLPAKAYYYVFGQPVSIESPAAILFSSGSEGAPKGIVLSHRNFITNIKQISDVLRTQEDEVVMGSLPPFHSFGLTVTTLLPLVEGIPVICHPDPTDVLTIAKAISTYKATLLCATATFLRLYTRNKKVSTLMLESLRTIVAGAERLPDNVRNDFKAKFNKDIYEGYGATETTPVASVNVPDKLDPNDWQVQIGQKVGTVGMPLPGCAFRIVDPLTLNTLPNNEDGLILISGNQVMIGYLNDPLKTEQAIVEINGRRWYKTGDKGHLDNDGFLTIVDRYSRFAKVGGEMISLTAVEQEIHRVVESLTTANKDKVKDEIELLAVNIPDDKKGEKIVVLVTQQLSLTTLKEALLNNNCHALMLPSDVFVVDELPKLGSGKSDFSSAKKVALSFINKEVL